MDKQFTFKLSEELLGRVKERAGYRPVSDLMRSLLEEWLEPNSRELSIGEVFDSAPSKIMASWEPEFPIKSETQKSTERVLDRVPEPTSELTQDQIKRFEEKQREVKAAKGPKKRRRQPSCLSEMAHEAGTCSCK